MSRLLVGGVEVAPVEVLTTFWARQRGLLGSAPSTRAVWFPRCRSVHTWGMTYALDVAWLDADGGVLATRRLSPWRGPTRPLPLATDLLEAPAGAFGQWGITRGAQVGRG